MGKANVVATTDRRVAQVVGIIGRDKARVDEIEQAIRNLDANEAPDPAVLPWPPYPLKTRDKSIALSLSRAVGRLEKQLRRHDGGGVLARATYGWKPDFFEWRAQLKCWRECFEAFAGKAKAEPGIFGLPTTTTWPLGPPKPSAPKFVRKHNAVAAAAAILKRHGLRPTATRKTSTREASLFCRVAAVLAGDPRIYHQCRAFVKKARNRVSR
jgi:hypothetical protein